MQLTRILVAGLIAARMAHPARGDDSDFFEKKIRPVLAQHCFKCHGEKQQKGGIRLDGAGHLRDSGDGSGPLIVAGRPQESRLIQVLHHIEEPKMPPAGKLPEDTIGALSEWVARGAVWPTEANVGHAIPRGKDHWAFRPVKAGPEPEVKAANWPASPIDRFVLAKLEARGLEPSPAADRATLIRRLAFDLTGLPPTAEEVEAFAKDSSAAAIERLVDRLLGSKQYGERWGRHWLDVARYADSKGPIANQDPAYLSAFTYRDWVIRAFNEDLPYNQFLIKQLAADHQGRVEGHPDLAALGLLTLGRKFEDSEPDIIDDRLDVIFRGVQGLSIGCARCHDHKYDPISIRDYYSLYGVFAGSREKEAPILSGPRQRLEAQAHAIELRARVRDYERFLEVERRRVFGDHRRKANRYLLAAAARAPGKGHLSGQDKADTNPDGLHPAIVTMYRSFLDGTRADERHRVMAPWHAFAALKPEEFATRGKTFAAKFAANDDEQKPLATLVARLFEVKPPVDLADVARRYGTLFASVARKWEKRIAEADRNDLERPIELDDEAEDEIRQVVCGPYAPLDDRATGEFRDRLDDERKAKHDALKKAVSDWIKDPSAPPTARVVQDADEPPASRVFVRGKPEQPGETVPRQFLPALAGTGAKPFSDGTGRYELARAIASKANPLTARVWVNRVWAHLFGNGLVATPSDFGVRAEPPTHPELLDRLAADFMEDSWSTRRLIRRIVLSKVYQQSSAERPRAREVDAANTLVWRMNRKRLGLEPLRDAMLAAAGTLDPTIGGRSIDPAASPGSRRRTIYLAVNRESLPGVFRSFDFANPDLHTPSRHETTVPQQALFLLNSPFVGDQSRTIARRAEGTEPVDDTNFVLRVFRLTLTREPRPEELGRCTMFLAAASSPDPSEGPRPGRSLSPREKLAQVLLMSNEFIFVD